MSKYDGKCNRCEKDGGETQYSFGIYASFLCRECAIEGFRDACGLIDVGPIEPCDEQIEAEESCVSHLDFGGDW